MRASPRSGVSAAMACSWRLHRRVLPAAGGRDFRVDLVWPPGAWLVFVDGGGVLQHRIDDSPRLFDVVLPSEQRGVSLHGVSEDSLVRVHLIGAGELSPQHFGALAARLLPRRDDVRADGDRDVGTDPQPAVIRLEVEAVKHRGRPAESDDDLRARHGQALSGSDVEGYALPAPGIDLESQGDKRLRP